MIRRNEYLVIKCSLLNVLPAPLTKIRAVLGAQPLNYPHNIEFIMTSNASKTLYGFIQALALCLTNIQLHAHLTIQNQCFSHTRTGGGERVKVRNQIRSNCH